MATGYDGNAARRGQAFNLAVHDATNAGKQDNPKYIYQKYIYYLQLADIVQSSDLDLIQEVINSPDYDKMLKMIQDAFKEKNNDVLF